MEKIGKASPLRRTFPEYTGPETYEACSEFIEKKFFYANGNRQIGRRILTVSSCLEVPNKNICK